MSGGLIGDDVGNDAARKQRLVDVGGIAVNCRSRRRGLSLSRGIDHGHRLIEIVGARVEETIGHALGDALLIDLDAEDDGTGHAPRQRLRTAHAAKPGRQDEPAFEAVAEMTLGDAHEDFIGALDHALRADVLPVAGRQAAPADQVLLLPFIKVLGFRPLADHVAVGHDDDRRLFVRLDQADRLAGLHDQGFAVDHGPQRLDDLVVRRPIARSLAERRIDHEIGRVLADRQHVFEQAQAALPGASRGSADWSPR